LFCSPAQPQFRPDGQVEALCGGGDAKSHCASRHEQHGEIEETDRRSHPGPSRTDMALAKGDFNPPAPSFSASRKADTLDQSQDGRPSAECRVHALHNRHTQWKLESMCGKTKAIPSPLANETKDWCVKGGAPGVQLIKASLSTLPMEDFNSDGTGVSRGRAA
jgi:hypothetical protein